MSKRKYKRRIVASMLATMILVSSSNCVFATTLRDSLKETITGTLITNSIKVDNSAFEFDTYAASKAGKSLKELNDAMLLLWAPLYGASYQSNDYLGLYLVDNKFVLASVNGLADASKKQFNGSAEAVNDSRFLSGADAIYNFASRLDASSFRGGGSYFLADSDGVFAPGRSMLGSAKGHILFDKKYVENSSYARHQNIAYSLNRISASVLNKDLTDESAYQLELLLRLVGKGVSSINASEKNAAQYVIGTSGKDAVVVHYDNDASKLELAIVYYDGMIASTNRAVADLLDLLNLVESLYKNKARIPDDALLLKHLVEQVGGYRDRLSDAEDQKAEEDAKDQLVSASEFAKLPMIEKWHQVLMTYYTKGSESLTAKDSSGKSRSYNLSQFGNEIVIPDSSSKWNDLDSLAVEERLRLRAFATIRAMYDPSNSLQAAMTYPALVPGIKDGMADASYAENNVIVESAGINNAMGKTPEDVMEAAKQVVAKFDAESPVASTSASLIAENLDSIVKYLAVRLYGIKTDTSGSNDQANRTDGLTSTKGSKYIESLIPQVGSKVSGLSGLPYAYLPGAMLSMRGVIGEVSDSLDGNSSMEAYYQIYHVLALAEYYAAYSAGMEVIDGAKKPYKGSDYKNRAIDELLADVGKVQNPEGADLKGLEGYVKAFVSIADAVEYLGIQPSTLSPQMQKIIEYSANLLPFTKNKGLASYDNSNAKTEPMSTFFNLGSAQFAPDYLTGVELSSTFVPMQTNLYDVNSVKMISDSEWVMRFHYPYGFYRKALYIDDDVNAAVNYGVTKKKGTTRPATLKDLFQPEKDVVLYLDDNQYNIDKIAEMQGLNYTRLANTEDSSKDLSEESLSGRISDWWQAVTGTDIESIAKTGASKTYSENIKKKVSEYKDTKEKGSEYVLSCDAIDTYLKGYSTNADEEVYSEYTPVQSYAVTSAIYRDKVLFNLVNKIAAKQTPVFISSPNLAAVNGASEADWNSIYNYIMLKNLKASVGVSYKTVLDVTSLLYMDIYGNIVTESGLVVIPAMSNATIQKSSAYVPYTVGFISLYNHGEYKIPLSYNNSEKFLSERFEKNEEDDCWELKRAKIDGHYIEFEGLSASNEDTLSLFMNVAKSNLNKQDALLFNEGVYRITEVLRGAPIENINKSFEGLTLNGDVSKFGIYTAYKLEELSNALMTSTNGNSLVALPNLAFMSGVEYVVFFLFKIMFLILLVLLFVKIYHDSIEGRLGIKSVFSFVISCVMFIASAFAVPSLMDLSYYQSNKHLLQKEAVYLALLNLEKESEGREIGLTSVDSYDSSTKLYLKVDDLSIPWYSIISKVLLGSSINTVKEAYEAEQSESLMANLPGMVQKGNGLYIDINTMFDGTRVEYDPDLETLYSVTSATPYASFVTPYYFFLDQLIARVNDYNTQRGISNYSVKVMGHGAVKTVGMVTPYFTSDLFWEQSQDLTGLKALYGVPTTLVESSILDDDSESTDRVKASKWYREDYDLELVDESLTELQEVAKEYVTMNKDLLGKVTDESFLKIMALDLAVEYNKQFGVNAASAIELYDIDARDLIRLSITQKSNVMVDAPKSFARFVYDNCGTFGTFTVILLVLVYFVASIVKPVCIFLIIGASVVSIVIRRLIKKDNISSVEGFVITMALLCGINILYSLLLKASMVLPNLGLTPQVACIVQVMIQCLYLVILCSFVSFVLQDWQNMGFVNFTNAAMNVRSVVVSGTPSIVVEQSNVYTTRERQVSSYRKYSRSEEQGDGREYLNRMRMNDERRRENYGKRFKGNHKRPDES